MQAAHSTPVPFERGKKPPLFAYDAAIVCILATIAATMSWHCAHRISYGLRGAGTVNVWFESDVSRVYENMSYRMSDHYRSKVHPLFSLFATPISYAIAEVAHFGLDDAANATLAGIAGVWAAVLYLLLRRLDFDLGMAFLASAAGMASASSLLFLSVPETYGMSSLSVMMALLTAIAAEGAPWEAAGKLAASAMSLSITVTNWMLGLILTFDSQRLGRWAQMSINAFFLVTLLWTAEKALMPSAEFFTAFSEERRFWLLPSPTRVRKVATAFFFHSAIAPAVELTRDFGVVEEAVGPDWPFGLTFQNAWPGSGSPWGMAAGLLWAAALFLGFRRIARSPRHRIMRAIVGFLAFQLLLHTVYGIETFMYGLNWLPMLLVVAAAGFSELGKARWPALAVLVALLAINNVSQFDRITTLIAAFQQEHPVSHPLTRKEMIHGCK